MTPLGSTSFITTFAAASSPVFETTIVYSRVSPGATPPPFRSTTVLAEVARSGRRVEIDVTRPPSKKVSALESVVMVAALCPAVSRLVGIWTTSRSMPLRLCESPVNWGRSPTLDAPTPSSEWVLLKKLSTGFRASNSAVPPTPTGPHRSSSPAVMSPSYAMTPSFALNPVAGTTKPEIVDS